MPRLKPKPSPLICQAVRVCEASPQSGLSGYPNFPLKHFALLAMSVLAMSGCASLGSDAAKSLPPQAVLRDAESLGLASSKAGPVLSEPQWWRTLADEQLDRLIEQALRDNPTLKVVQARIVRAQAGVESTQAAAGPQLGLAVDLSSQRYTANGAVPPPLAGAVRDSGSALISGSWELDFFGKNRAALDAALGQSRAVQADALAARMLLAYQVARTYFQTGRLNAQIELTEKQLALRAHMLALVQTRFEAGLDTRVELLQAQSSMPELRQQLVALQEQLALASHALDALLGQPKSTWVLKPPALPESIKALAVAEVPADLLGRRADIAAARWRVEAAIGDVATARNQFYPNVNLLAFVGMSSIGLDRLLSAGSEQWGGGPALRLPLFDGGRLRAQLRGRSAELDLAIESYNATVIDAIHDVADQLSSAQATGRQQSEQLSAQALAQDSLRLAEQRQAGGLTNRVAVINAELGLLSQRRQALELSARALDTHLALIRALGGGYLADLPTSPATPMPIAGRASPVLLN